VGYRRRPTGAGCDVDTPDRGGPALAPVARDYGIVGKWAQHDGAAADVNPGQHLVGDRLTRIGRRDNRRQSAPRSGPGQARSKLADLEQASTGRFGAVGSALVRICDSRPGPAVPRVRSGRCRAPCGRSSCLSGIAPPCVFSPADGLRALLHQMELPGEAHIFAREEHLAACVSATTIRRLQMQCMTVESASFRPIVVGVVRLTPHDQVALADLYEDYPTTPFSPISWQRASSTTCTPVHVSSRPPGRRSFRPGTELPR
jgi:hypothetical protein